MSSKWRGVFLFILVVLSLLVKAQNVTDIISHRRLAAPGNVAACYTPFHNPAYPMFGGPVDINALRAAIEADFALLSQHFTHVRTYYSMHYGIEVAPIAKKYGLKLYLGMFMTSASWQADEMQATANAIKYYSDTVEVVMVGNENLAGWYQRSGDILAKVNQLKQKAGGDAWRVKYGTVQRITEYLDPAFSWEMQNLNANLDILGVNIYPFFNNQYNGARPTELLDAQWNAVINGYPREKLRLTETGFPTAGSPSGQVIPGLDASIAYYQAVVNWQPSGTASNLPKFWFQAFDRRNGDPAAYADFERFFGFFGTDRRVKRAGFPQLVSAVISTAQFDQAGGKPAQCGVESGVDYIGNDFMNTPSSTANGCIAICRRQSGCKAFSWSNYQGGTCWLKTGIGQTASNANIQSGAPCPCIEYGVDYMGMDIGNSPSASADGCQAICRRTNGCSAFSWSSYQGGTCWLKSGRKGAISLPGVSSGVLCPL